MAPIPLPDWIQGARLALSNEDYLEAAVSVALQLTNRLCLVTGNNACANFNDSLNSLSSWNKLADLFSSSEENKAGNGLSSDLLLVQIEDIIPENILISITNDNEPNLSSAVNFTANKVNIQSNSNTPSAETPHTPRAVCRQLGQILFELFSQGDPLLMIELMDDNEGDGFFSDLFVGDINLDFSEQFFIDHEAAPPSGKRTSGSASAVLGSNSLKAKSYLEGKSVPLSICQLVSDLLEAEEGNRCITSTALLSLDDVKHDLMNMKVHPQRFLHDRTCPRQALENTALFSQVDCELFGREQEMMVLMNAATRVALHVPSPHGINDGQGQLSAIQVDDFLCECAFLSGHSGAGKLRCIKNLLSFCHENDWFVLVCKFDKHAAPLSSLLHAFDTFFGRFLPVQVEGEGEYRPRDPSMEESFHRISNSIITSVDSESFATLAELLPNFCMLFPVSNEYTNLRNMQNQRSHEFDSLASFASQSMDGLEPSGSVGSGRNRLLNLLHIVFKALCSGGHPVVVISEDLQWADAFTMEIICDYIRTAGYSSPLSVQEVTPRGGMFLVGSFREEEIDQNGFLADQIKALE
mmetsp:Transcript_3115/g.6866  ORF Transcript_3115/g.6866 Transcript_3115/m.6866 type:complete len:581 (+) Transcript_3115:107-1849(+)